MARNLGENLRGRGVLFVTDSSSESLGYMNWLQEIGATVTHVTPESVAEVSATSKKDPFDVVLFDSHGHSRALLPAVGDLMRELPGCPVVLASGDGCPHFASDVRGLGAMLLPKPCERTEFLLCLTTAIEAQVPCLRALTASAVRRWSLSPQQARILYYNLWSLSNQEIAEALNVTLHTVQDYQIALRRKTGARGKDGYLRRILEIAGVSPPMRDRPTPV